MTDAEKLLQLKEKCNSLKQANKVLKEGLLEKQDSCGRLEQQLKEKDATLREQLEEIDRLQFQNGRVTKQVGTLTSQLEEQKQRQSSQSGWSVGGLGLISGKQQQEAVQKAEEEIKVLQSELMMKIQENEDLHIQLFEAKKHHEEERDRLRRETSKASAELETRASDLASERKKSGGLLEESQRQMSEIQRLSDECVARNALADSLRSSLESSRREAAARIGALNARLRRLQPFDEDQHDMWTAYSTSSRQGRDSGRRQKAAEQLRTSVAEACRQGGEVLRSWASTFGGGGDGESGARLRMRNRMSDTVETLAKMVQEQLPGLIGHIDLVHLVPTSEWDRQLGATSKDLLAAHRKWVVYQSLLLLHDWNSAYAARSAQEEAQALRFVDWLWRLHRCLRGLFLRLRLLACAHALSAAAASAAHFALASAAVRPGELGAEESGQAHPAAGPGTASRAPASASLAPSAAKQQPRASTASAPVAQAGGEAATRLVLALRRSVQDIAQCWESIGRCLSAWASSQANPSGADLARPDRGSAVELIELVHRFNGCLADRALPAVAQALEMLPRRLASDDPAAAARLAPLPPACVVVGRPRPAPSTPDCYLGRARVRLAGAPAPIGFKEAVQTRQLARRFSAANERLSSEVRQQVRRVQTAVAEKSQLEEDLRALQDDHALLRSNFQVLKDNGAAAVQAPSSSSSAVAAAATSAARSDLVLSSRQRALLDSMSVTAQESASLRQHGYFVEVISLTPSDVALAAGPPPPAGSAADSGTADATGAGGGGSPSSAPAGGGSGCGAAQAPDMASWEVAVRRVYEQQVRRLQAQIRVADAKAMELHVSVQQSLDNLRHEEQEKTLLRNEAAAAKAQLLSLQEDMAATRRNYDTQLAMLTEHICSLSTKISDKDENLATLQAKKVLCGRCGMWNVMGKLLSDDSGGMCQTCKEKVLGRS